MENHEPNSVFSPTYVEKLLSKGPLRPKHYKSIWNPSVLTLNPSFSLSHPHTQGKANKQKVSHNSLENSQWGTLSYIYGLCLIATEKRTQHQAQQPKYFAVHLLSFEQRILNTTDDMQVLPKAPKPPVTSTKGLGWQGIINPTVSTCQQQALTHNSTKLQLKRILCHSKVPLSIHCITKTRYFLRWQSLPWKFIYNSHNWSMFS